VQSDAATVDAYLEDLAPDRRAALEAVRAVILAHLPDGYVETMNWGMISYEVPLAVCPDTYNGHPLSYAGLASQKRHMAVYLSNVYVDPALRARLEAGYAEAGLKLDMGASCVRFTRLDKVPLEVIGEMIAATPVDEFVAAYSASRAER
jgi:uncharacterized protein YdhG (YjbR/CyaY superfamily)